MDANKPLQSTLALLPGLMCDSRLFAAQRSEGVVIVDGFYGGADSLEGMADYALARLPDRFALVGHSMGARVALEVYRKAPERVERIALANTGVHPVQPGEREKRYRLRDIGREQGMESLVDTWLPPMLGPDVGPESELRERLRAMCLDAGLAIFEAQIEALLSRPEVDDVLARIDCPALSVTGEADAWSPPDQHARIAQAIAGCELRIVPSAGHMLPAEKPQAFNSALGEWLASHAREPEPTK